MSAFVTTAYVQDGKLHVRNRKAFDEAVESWTDGEYIVTVEKAHATRSHAQQGFYFAAYVRPLAAHHNCTDKAMHAFLKERFLPPRRVLLYDAEGFIVDEFEQETTTTTLNKLEFSEYLDRIADYAATLGVAVGSRWNAA